MCWTRAGQCCDQAEQLAQVSGDSAVDLSAGMIWVQLSSLVIS